MHEYLELHHDQKVQKIFRLNKLKCQVNLFHFRLNKLKCQVNLFHYLRNMIHFSQQCTPSFQILRTGADLE